MSLLSSVLDAADDGMMMMSSLSAWDSTNEDDDQMLSPVLDMAGELTDGVIAGTGCGQQV